jgi:hypothetical protein
MHTHHRRYPDEPSIGLFGPALCGLPVALMGIAYRRLRCVILAVLIQRSSERTGVYHIRFIVAHRWAGNVLSF